MTDHDIVQLLAKISEQQGELIEQLREQQKKPSGKDFWDRTMAIAPIVSAIIIACTGAYFTYSYNLQQLKVQEIQTIEKFLPHLAGDERSKKAAILAISSLGNAKLAAKVASVFASEGTASALTSLARSSYTEPSDQQAVREALYKTLDALADRSKSEHKLADAMESSNELAARSQNNDEEICINVDKLAQLFAQKGDREAAEELERRSAALKKHPVVGEQATVSKEESKPTFTNAETGVVPKLNEGTELAILEKAKSKQSTESKPPKPPAEPRSTEHEMPAEIE